MLGEMERKWLKIVLRFTEWEFGKMVMLLIERKNNEIRGGKEIERKLRVVLDRLLLDDSEITIWRC